MNHNARRIFTPRPEGVFPSIHDSQFKEYKGAHYTLIGPLDEALYDRDEVGPMFLVRTDAGHEVHAFADELEGVWEDGPLDARARVAAEAAVRQAVDLMDEAETSGDWGLVQGLFEAAARYAQQVREDKYREEHPH